MKLSARQSALLISIIVIAILGWSCAKPTAKLKVSRNEIKQGDPVTVSWETKNARSVLLNGENVERIGAKTVTLTQTTTYEHANYSNCSTRGKCRAPAQDFGCDVANNSPTIQQCSYIHLLRL